MGTMHLPTTKGAQFTGNCVRQQQVAVAAFCGLAIMMRSFSNELRDGYGSGARCKSEFAR